MEDITNSHNNISNIKVNKGAALAKLEALGIHAPKISKYSKDIE